MQWMIDVVVDRLGTGRLADEALDFSSTVETEIWPFDLDTVVVQMEVLVFFLLYIHGG